MEILVYLLVIATISILVLLVHELVFGKREAVLSRLNEVRDVYNDPVDDLTFHQPFNDRIIKPAYQKLTGFIGKVTPYGISKNLEQTIVHAGSPNNMTVNRLIAIMIMTGILVSIVAYMLFSRTGGNLNKLLLIAIFGIIGFMVPFYMIRSTASTRKAKIQKSLPDMLDLLFVSVEAGLGFDMALKRTTEKMPGPLSEEINRALDEINKGRDRVEALKGIVYRTGVEDLSSFITAVIQSEQLGSNIANMLRVQSSSMRQKRRQRAEEKAMKVPVKMLFPLVILMFPALYIVILGPAIIRIMNHFGDMF
ncbi:type II secretion system F family protein [Tissierella creatinini]|nr:type II secretion system F family protein [Tissierella creatinini]TJX61515.1 type II secretion system F family protein [Soehngenia saccharolytica]